MFYLFKYAMPELIELSLYFSYLHVGNEIKP